MAESNLLQNYYELTFLMIKNYGFSLTEIESMIPYEKDIYVYSIYNFLEEMKKGK